MKRKNADQPVNSPAGQLPASSSGGFEVEATEVLMALQSALRTVINRLPQPVTRSIDLQKMLQLDTKLAWQLYKFSEAESVFSASVMLPGILPLERFLSSCSKHGISPALLTKVRRHFDAFEKFVAARAGSRASFNSMIGAGNRDAKALDLFHRKASFRAAAHFTGLQTDTYYVAQILHPSARTADSWDRASLIYKLGVRRLRPNVRVRLSQVFKNTPLSTDREGNIAEGKSWFEGLNTSDGDDSGVATLLPAFCSNGFAEMILTRDNGGNLDVELAAGGIGKEACTDWAFGVVERNVQNLPGQSEPLQFKFNMATAIQTLIVDLLYFDRGDPEPQHSVDVSIGFFGGQPDTGEFRPKLDLVQTVEFLGKGLSGLDEPCVPRLPEFIAHACTELGWKPEALKVYRCKVEYPLMGSSVSVMFKFL